MKAYFMQLLLCPKGFNAHTHTYQTAVDTSFSVHCDGCFPKGKEKEVKHNILKLMKYNYTTTVVKCIQCPTKKLQGANLTKNLTAI
jgi:hypothetical protein